MDKAAHRGYRIAMKLVAALPFALLLACRAAPAATPLGPDGAVHISATEEGFSPSRIQVAAGSPVKLVFTREVEKTCVTAVVFPQLGIEKDLPLHTPVMVEVTPNAGGTIDFQCPMKMGTGTVVALPQS